MMKTTCFIFLIVIIIILNLFGCSKEGNRLSESATEETNKFESFSNELSLEELQKLNRDKKSASNDMCTLLAMNTAGFQLVPTTVIAVLAACGDKNPSSIVLPTLLVTSVTFLFALVIVKLLEKISPAQPDLEKEGEQHD